MHVVHVVPARFGRGGVVGGAERYAFELARAMAPVVQTTLVAFGDEDGDETVGPLRVRTLGHPWYVRGQRSNPVSPRLFGLLRGADVVHCHQHHVMTSSLVALWSRAFGRRVFVSDLGGGGWDLSAYVSTDAWFHGHLHLSEYSRQVFGHEGNARARIVGGGVDTVKFSPEPSVSRDGGILFVGRLVPHKGVHDLLRGLPVDVPLTIVAPRPDENVRAQLAALAAGKAVTFAFDLSDDALVREYRRARCVVLPSVYRSHAGETKVPELLGQTLLEGMACEAAAVCTRVASMPEIVQDGVTGFVVPPNDPARLGECLAWVMMHPDEASAMGRAGRRRVLQQYTWSAVVERCLDAYRGVPAAEVVAMAMSGRGPHTTRTARSVWRTGLTPVRESRRPVHRG
jgi:glycosyltransferase involved in cell wall biosynthesis